ncbi:HlyD family efflux transporter periplasmic adaptor subunit [Hydrogenophaga sp.]|uniref:HlyD family efflux transporter periplasmic adaptor subunit n=1 Tax=Hydrogenophaga sp. TaxID=1904254 RepID=UPI002C19FE20|nr:HlyD family efflux transporter periplasmic adaptor subunit [Hydrogenophaga sp.]HMP11861.1 HlyD family efflux transporter periplasmic adaptor subunit [Hydrogenophaga sp.]
MNEAADLDLLLQIESRALTAPDAPGLRFTIVNESHALVSYRQAALFELDGGRPKLTGASGLVSVAEDSPFAVWMAQMARRLPQDGQTHRIDLADAPETDQAGWAEWLPEHAIVVPLKDGRGEVLGMVLYARDAPWTDRDQTLIERLHLTFGHCLRALSETRERRWSRWRRWMRGRRRNLLLAALVLALFIPVRLSVLAPAEVVALSAVAVAAPQDGVIGSFGVAPNSRVRANDLLFSLDDSVLLNRREVALKALEVARVDAHIAQQRAFDDVRGRADLAVLMGRVREKEAELAAVETLSQRVEVRADRDGVAIFADVNDWLGRPVQTGERVMQLAQPEDAGVLVWLAVADAINLEPGAPVQLFLHTDPLRPRSAVLVEASYQATPSPDDVASYRLRARFEPGEDLPRIGLRGTARISGEWVTLGYYLFRRPMAAAREWTGL